MSITGVDDNGLKYKCSKCGYMSYAKTFDEIVENKKKCKICRNEVTPHKIAFNEQQREMKC